MRFPLEVRYNDYDVAGHVNNAVYLTYFEIARVRAWDALGLGGDPTFVVAAATVRYVTPALVGEPLDVEIELGEVRTRAWSWRYRVLERTADRLVADGETTQVFYDFARRASAPIPDALRGRLTGATRAAAAGG